MRGGRWPRSEGSHAPRSPRPRLCGPGRRRARRSRSPRRPARQPGRLALDPPATRDPAGSLRLRPDAFLSVTHVVSPEAAIRSFRIRGRIRLGTRATVSPAPAMVTRRDSAGAARLRKRGGRAGERARHVARRPPGRLPGDSAEEHPVVPNVRREIGRRFDAAELEVQRLTACTARHRSQDAGRGRTATRSGPRESDPGPARR
jgi:hypothetical protein